MPYDNEFLVRQLKRPTGPVDVVLDTDTYNEIDDQYALAYMLLSPDKLRLKAVYAAPFSNEKAATPGEGMEKSYQEILNVLDLCGKADLKPHVFKGSATYLPDEKTPVASSAADDLIQKAMAHSPENPLYVVAIGAITNVASALLMKPEIADRVVIIFLGGQPLGWVRPEFNLSQDIAAGRVVFGSGAPLVQIPCMSVATHLTTTEPELREHIKGKSKLGSYLYDITCHEASTYDSGPCWSRVIWDISAVAWLLDERFVWDRLIPAPIPGYDHGFVIDQGRHVMKVACFVERDAVFADLFKKIAGSV